MTSPVYWHPRIYTLSLRLLYGQHYLSRYQEVAKFIPQAGSVLDLCAGDCALYRHALNNQNINYLAVDFLQGFTSWAEKKGIKAKCINIVNDPIPEADIIVMMGSLYHFIPRHNSIIEKMIQNARQRVIISEPVNNLIQKQNPLLKFIARFLTQVHSQEFTERFDENSFTTIMQSHGFQHIKPIANGREMIAVYEKQF